MGKENNAKALSFLPPVPQSPNKRRKAEGLQRRLLKAVKECYDYLEKEGLKAPPMVTTHDAIDACRVLGKHVRSETRRKYCGPSGSPTYVSQKGG